MKKWIKIVGLILLLLLLGFIIWKIITYKEKYFNPIVFTETEFIFNTTKTPHYDTVVYVGLVSLGLDSTIVVLKDLTNDVKNNFPNDFILKAHIRGEGKQYVIWIDKMGRMESIDVLSHEFIHLLQYHTKQLVIKKDSAFWNGEYVDIQNIKYEKRPWEVDAEHRKIKLNEEMKKILYE